MINGEHTMRRLGRREILVAALAVMGLASASEAMPGPDPVTLSLIDRDTGLPIRVWWRAGRLYVAGQTGARYGLRLANRTGERVMAVLSVDGVNVLTGETAGYDQRGYVIDPYQSYDVTGWRKSDTEVAAFTFAPLPHSYAARTGRPADVGVIGMAVFTERRPPPADVAGARERALPAPAAAEPLGTAHGPREWSAVHAVAFIRASAYPVSLWRIEYDSYENLVRRGVIPSGPAYRPRPFPAAPDGLGYVPDPARER